METTLTTNFTPEKEVIELLPAEKKIMTMQEMLDDYNKEIPAIEEPEKKDAPTVH